MEYGINFNDDDTIITALENLDNTFFIKYSNSDDSEDKKESNIIPNNVDDEITLDFDNNSNLNDFEFEEVPDNYIEDKIYDNLKLKVKEFFKKGKCSCCSSNQPCFMKIGHERFLKCQTEFESLDKNMQDMVVKGQLMAFQKDKNTRKVSESNRKVVRFNYYYNNDLPICHATYKNLIGASHKYLDTIIQHLREYGIEECIYGNTGRAPKNMNRIKVNYDIACDVFSFLKNYSNVYGMPSPRRYCNEISMPVVFLPTSFSYSSVYRDYVQAYKKKHEPGIHVMSESTFVKIWKSLMPSLQFMSPKSDLCENWETIKMEIQYIIQHEKNWILQKIT
ncbi:hypothetical protein GLOIN_2v466922 [Rhizophagus clarus]|nr:hypothetical protein GLOIN_2v466922 [Rhizophagus clarus]